MAEPGAPSPESTVFADAVIDVLSRWWNGLKGSTAGDADLDRLKMDIRRAASGVTGTGLETTIDNWVAAAVRSIASTLRDPDMAKWQMMGVANLEGGLVAADNESQKAMHEFLYREFEKAVMAIVHEVAKGIAAAVRFTSGIDIRAEDIEGIADGSTSRDDKIALGTIIKRFYEDTLINESVAAGFLNRTPGDAEWVNFQAVAGASLRIQAGDIMMDAVGSKLPLGLGKPLGNIAEKIDKAIALEDAFEELVQVPLQANIQRGLEAWYNRKLKPADLSATEAFHAVIAGKLTESDLGKVLDNAGYRDDIRQILRGFAASNLTESDLQDSYNRGLLTRTQVKEQYKSKFFEEPDAELKTKLVEGDRRKKLEEKVYELWGNLYRDGVAAKQEVTPYLESYGLKPDEQALWFQVQELERRQRKWLSNAQIEDMLEAGLMDVGFAIDYQVLQGMTGEDATNLYMEYILKKFKKDLDDDCQKILKEAFTPAKLLSGLLAKLPTFNLGGLFGKVELEKILQCLLTNTTKVP